MFISDRIRSSLEFFFFSNTEENNDSYIVVISVRSVYCQTEINKNDIDLNLFRYLHSRETQTEQQLFDEKKVRYSSIVILFNYKFIFFVLF